MSQQTDLLWEIAAAMSSGAADRIRDWFTEDFRLHEPGKPALPVGHEGARQMMEAGRQNRMRAGVQTPAKVEILDMIQQGDRVAVRWQVTATAHNGDPYEGRVSQSIALRTDVSPRIGASLLRHFGPEGAAWSQIFGSDH